MKLGNKNDTRQLNVWFFQTTYSWGSSLVLADRLRISLRIASQRCLILLILNQELVLCAAFFQKPHCMIFLKTQQENCTKALLSLLSFVSVNLPGSPDRVLQPWWLGVGALWRGLESSALPVGFLAPETHGCRWLCFVSQEELSRLSLTILEKKQESCYWWIMIA